MTSYRKIQPTKFRGLAGANRRENSLSLLCLGEKSRGIATTMNAAMRSEMTAATPAAVTRHMLAEVYQRKREAAALHLAL